MLATSSQLVMLATHVESTYTALVKAAFGSIFDVFIVSLAGFLLAFRGVLNSQASKHLNGVNIALFTPCLLFGKVAFNLTPDELRELWIIPTIFVIMTATSMLASWILGHVLGLKRSQRNFAMAAAMFPNTNSLPVALIQSLLNTVPSLMLDGDDKGAMLGRALTYLMVYYTLAIFLRWSYGVQLLTTPDDTAQQSTQASLPVADDRFNGESIAIPKGPLVVATSADARLLDDESAGEVEGLPPPNGRLARTEPSRSVWQTRFRRGRAWLIVTFRSINNIMTAPLWAAVASVVVAYIPPLQSLLRSQQALPLTRAISNAGQCSVPVTLIVLGAYFYRDEKEKGKATTQNGRQLSFKQRLVELWMHPRLELEPHPEGESTTVFVALLSRMVITPFVLFPLLYLFARQELHPAFKDPVFVVANVLVVSSPPAITLAQLTQHASGDAFERLISRTMLWSYVILTPPLTVVYVVAGLAMSRL